MTCHRRQRYVGFGVMALAMAGSASASLQPEPIAAMFRADSRRDKALAASFQPIELPATGTAPTLHLYLTAGDLERAFDSADYRPDAAIMPTNTNLLVTAASPTTQRMLIARVMKHPTVMADLQEQIGARRQQARAAAGDAVLEIGVDSFVARLPKSASADVAGAFPRHVCLIATDFPTGGAVNRRDLFAQERVRKGVGGCLAALDAAAAGSIVLPLLGAASAQTQSHDPGYEGQRLLQECRHLNAVAGIALGIHDFAPGRRGVREIGIVQWDREIAEMFGRSDAGQASYRLYAEQIKRAVAKGLAGERTTPADVDGSCAATLSAAGGA